MKSRHVMLQVLGILGLLSLLVLAGPGGAARAGDLTAKEAATAPQTQPPPATLAGPPDSPANPEHAKSDPSKSGAQADDKRIKTAKILAVFLKLFEGYQGPAR